VGKEEFRGVFKILKDTERIPLGRPNVDRKTILKWFLKELGCIG
jgi:hypothetical protein